jgi:hypothetical protein
MRVRRLGCGLVTNTNATSGIVVAGSCAREARDKLGIELILPTIDDLNPTYYQSCRRNDRLGDGWMIRPVRALCRTCLA